MRRMHSCMGERIAARLFRTVVEDDDSVEDAKDAAFASMIRVAESRRCLFRSQVYRKSLHDRFKEDLDGRDDDEDDETERQLINREAALLPWLTEAEFLQKYCMSYDSFKLVLSEIKDHNVFKRLEGKAGRPQTPVANQLMVFCKHIGTEGDGANGPNQCNTFGIGKGLSDVFHRCVTTAILSLRDVHYTWPDADERRELAKLGEIQCDFPNCVGIADGTLFPLAFEPEVTDAPDYSGRKHGFSITTMIICDYNKKIRYYLAGYPGSCHDNRVYNNTGFVKNPKACFSEMEHNVGDSAFSNSPFMVSSYRKAKGELLEADHEKFNTKLAKLRIRSQRCIGILKGRFPWLRSIRMKVTDDPKSMRRILRLVDATVILHNMLIEFREADRKEWIDDNDCSDYYDLLREPTDELNKASHPSAEKDCRRTQLLMYFKEKFFH